MRIGAILAPSEGPRYDHGPYGIVMQSLRKMDTNVLGGNVLAQRAARAALRTKKEWLPEVRRACARNQAIIRAAVKKVEGASFTAYPSKATMFVIDLSEARVEPDRVEERI